MKFDQIRRVRKAAHVTQEELAKRIGVNRALISKYETGIIEPSVSQLQKIASALGVPMMELQIHIAGEAGSHIAGIRHSFKVLDSVLINTHKASSFNQSLFYQLRARASISSR